MSVFMSLCRFFLDLLLREFIIAVFGWEEALIVAAGVHDCAWPQEFMSCMAAVECAAGGAVRSDAGGGR